MKRYKEALCDKVQESSQGLLGHLLEVLLEEITPNQNTIASARQCVLLILLSVKSDFIML